jgi:hypothetical protein
LKNLVSKLCFEWVALHRYVKEARRAKQKQEGEYRKQVIAIGGALHVESS